MLVLTRKLKEQILIGDDIKVTLIRCQGNTVRIGIEAPQEVRILRGELGPLAESAADQPTHELSDHAEVFAHPASGSLGSEKQPGAINRIKHHHRSTSGNRLTHTASPQVFVGAVQRSGDGPRLDRAPLAGFIANS